jgi:AraC-like DNA-binding protein
MSRERFFKSPELPFAECRCSSRSERRYKPHIHKAFCVGAVDQGEVSYRVGDRVERLRPGSLALINPETLHACNPAGSGGRSYYVLYLDALWCSRSRACLGLGESSGLVDAVSLDDKALYRRYVGVLEFLMGEGPAREKEAALIGLAKDIFLHACGPRPGAAAPSVRIAEMKARLGADLDEDVSTERIALDLGANPYTLLRKFKSATGLTPHAYRMNCRVERARDLLREGWEPSRVALECGFFDQSHLHRNFKAMTAVTPREYQVNFVQ